MTAPSPLVYSYSGAPMACPAYTPPFKALAVTIVVWAALGAWRYGAMLQEAPSAALIAWTLAAMAMMAYSVWHMLKAQTRVDAQGVHQTWVWGKTIAWGDVAYAKLVRVRGLEWLIAPRLFMKNHASKTVVIYISDAAVLDALARVVQRHVVVA